MDERFLRETGELRRMWEGADRGELREYLVRDVEDPRINLQSILTRHFLLEELFPGEFKELRYHELWFSAVMNWLLGVMKRCGGERLMEIHGALLEGRGEVAGMEVPGYVRRAVAGLPGMVGGVEVKGGVGLDDYVGVAARGARDGGSVLPEAACDTFRDIWAAVLGGRAVGERLGVMEAACGSANDYRYLDSYGIGRFLEYRGFDLVEGNVANAREMFPGVDLGVGNVLGIEAGDNSVDCLYVHDLFEHLSIAAMEQAVAEVCRVTRRGLCLNFFRMREGAEHVVAPHEHYHWNTLSLPRVVGLLEARGAAVEVLWVAEVLRVLFEKMETHNANACTLMVRMRGGEVKS